MGQELLGAEAPGDELDIDFEGMARDAAAAPSVSRSLATDTSPVADGGGGRAEQVPYTARTARAVLVRVAAGESLCAICDEAGMPHRGTVYRWVRAHPRFGEALGRAKAAGGPRARAMQLSTFDAVTANEICERMCEGEPLTAICRDPLMPSYSAVCRWRRTFPAFAAMLAEAREVQAERFCDEAVEIASAVTPETAFATHVRLTHLRWTAGIMAPRAFGKFKAQEPPGEPKEVHVLVKRYTLEMREDGSRRVVGYEPNPETRRPERVSEGEWSRAGFTDEEARYLEMKQGLKAERAARFSGGP